MKIPKKFQVFGPPAVTLSRADRTRLEPHLAGWNKLHEILMLGVFEDDLKRLIVLELMGKRRRDVLPRLVSRFSSAQRQNLKDRIASCLQKRK